MSSKHKPYTRGVDIKGRSKRPKSDFARLDRDLLRSVAYRTLSHPARSVLVALAFSFNGRNNGAIAFGVRAGRDWGLSRSATASALLELERAGFVRPTVKGGFAYAKRRVTEFRLTWESGSCGPATWDFGRPNVSIPRISHSPDLDTSSPAERTVPLRRTA